MINGRSMPDDMDPNYALQYPHQPYNGNPHMHPGELVLLRVIGTGRLQHPFHEHGNHVRVLARDGNLILSQTTRPAARKLAGPLLFTTTTTPGQAMDGIFYWTGKGLNWDVFGHGYDGRRRAVCVPGRERLLHDRIPTRRQLLRMVRRPQEAAREATVRPRRQRRPGDAARPEHLAAGPWYGGSPYLGPDATGRAVGATPIPPSGTVANDPGARSGLRLHVALA